MPFAYLEGIRTHYQVVGTGPPVLLFSPLGDEGSGPGRWRDRIWQGFRPAESLARNFQVITYNRRESGISGGRVESLSYLVLARQANELLEHLGIQHALLLGSCIGCSIALALAADFPARCRALLLHWPVGGSSWLDRGRRNFDRHWRYASEHRLAAVVERARQARMFWTTPESGPWVSVIRSDASFAKGFVDQNLERYLQIVTQSRDNLFSEDMPSGVNIKQLMAMQMPAFVMPGNDSWHTTSSAHQLRELIPNAMISPLMPPQQDARTIERWVFDCAAACDYSLPCATLD